MDTPEYKELYETAKSQYPNVLDYVLQITCLKYLSDQNIKSTNNIESINEVQEEC
jgi:hypothetical protein